MWRSATPSLPPRASSRTPHARCAATSRSTPLPTHGEVVRLFSEDGHGFILTSDGHEVYFHRNAVLDDIGQLKVGSKVRVEISEKEGAEGYQASTVRRLGKHQPVG